jgi:DNA polymerase III epsilon subunit-like protein
MKLLIFDTETTGLPPRRDEIDPATWPHIVQLSWMIYDTLTRKYVLYDYIIKCPVEIPEESTNIHKITQSMCEKQGFHFSDILPIFNECYRQCDLVIAHNFTFDRDMILVESMRINTSFSFSKPAYCTMLASTYLNQGKWPKLNWLYEFLFHEDVKNLHNSMIDVIVCFRCYMKNMYGEDIFEKVRGLKSKLC